MPPLRVLCPKFVRGEPFMSTFRLHACSPSRSAARWLSILVSLVVRVARHQYCTSAPSVCRPTWLTAHCRPHSCCSQSRSPRAQLDTNIARLLTRSVVQHLTKIIHSSKRLNNRQMDHSYVKNKIRYKKKINSKRMKNHDK